MLQNQNGFRIHLPLAESFYMLTIYGYMWKYTKFYQYFPGVYSLLGCLFVLSKIKLATCPSQEVVKCLYKCSRHYQGNQFMWFLSVYMRFMLNMDASLVVATCPSQILCDFHTHDKYPLSNQLHQTKAEGLKNWSCSNRETRYLVILLTISLTIP